MVRKNVAYGNIVRALDLLECLWYRHGAADHSRVVGLRVKDAPLPVHPRYNTDLFRVNRVEILHQLFPRFVEVNDMIVLCEPLQHGDAIVEKGFDPPGRLLCQDHLFFIQICYHFPFNVLVHQI